MQQDIRWQQRFNNYVKALDQLTEAVNLAHNRELSKLEKQGLIQAFEYTHELAWKTLKDFFEMRGNVAIYGSRDATKEAFQSGIITDGDSWMNMIKSRNQTTHTYNEATAQQIVDMIIDSYYSQLVELKKKLTNLCQ